MSGGGTTDLNLVIAGSLTTGVTSGLTDVSVFSNNGGSFQYIFTFGGGTSAGNVYIETSNDGTNWSLYPSSTLAYTSATTNHVIQVEKFGTKFVRAVVTNTSGTGGTVNVLAHLIQNPR